MSKRAIMMSFLGLFLIVALCGAKKQAGTLVDIQAVTKIRRTGLTFFEGSGTRIAPGIEVRFKVSGKGMVTLPILSVTFYDRDKKLVEKIENYWIKKGVKLVQSSDHRFKANQTQWVMFPYRNELKFAYTLVVAGEGKNLSASVTPGTAKPEDFDFQDK